MQSLSTFHWSLSQESFSTIDSQSDSEEMDVESITSSSSSSSGFGSRVVSAAAFEADLRRVDSLLDDADSGTDEMMFVPSCNREMEAVKDTFQTSHVQLMMALDETARLLNLLSAQYASLMNEQAAA